MSNITKNNISYSGKRFDLVQNISIIPSKALDMGCNNGQTSLLLKETFKGVQVFGIDINQDAVNEAITTQRIEEGLALDVDNLSNLREAIGNKTFDLILLGDILEHLKNPISTFSFLYELLNVGGEIIVSIPNMAHWELLSHLISQKLPRNPRGIYDDTHLHFFMKNNLKEFAPSGSEFEIVGRNFRTLEKGWTKWDKFLLPVLKNIPWLKEYFVFQYIFKVKKPRF